jgi:catechol 2,3-dioxygenase
MTERIHPGTTIGPVHLIVRDLGAERSFYEQALGLTARDAAPGVATLAAGETDLLVLTERPDAPRGRRTTGLYHFAILTPSRPALGAALRRIAGTRTPLHGASDHLVSEALYLADPETNGIEIYRDRPRDEWPRVDGELRMGSEPVDLDALAREAKDGPGTGIARGTRMGHVHLRVAHIEDSVEFYRDVLGFDLVQRWESSAAFLSAGGYHHHIGINTWGGVGAPAPPAGAAGLEHATIVLPDRAERDRVGERARKAGIEVEEAPGGLLTRDPSSNGIVLSAAS